MTPSIMVVDDACHVFVGTWIKWDMPVAGFE